MFCEWLTRGAVCSSVGRLLGLPRGSSCTHDEVMLGRLVEAAVNALKEGHVLRPAEVHDLLELLLAKSGAEVVLRHVIAEEAVAVDWDFCPLGFALEKPVAIFAGELVGKAEEYYEPYAAILRHFGMMHVFARASSDEEREEAFAQYGAEAVITCLRRPPWRLKTYVLTCDAPNPAAELLAKAMGLRLHANTTKVAPGVYVV